MIMFLRQSLAILALPVTVVVLIPVWIAENYSVELAFVRSPRLIALQCAGIVVLAVGAGLFIASVRRFAIEGKGTLAPWDPPRRFVVSGPYRFVRNPMISGIIFLLFGEALLLRSVPHAGWAVLCAALNLTYIPLVEEPQLKRRFGAPYEEYSRNVPRFVPRLTPWRQPTG